ncbi:MAG: NAD(P)-dependent oxidoreductase [Pseudomonadota bacterium]
MAKVAFLGLGVMGFPMAGHLTKAGHDVAVWNRTTETAERWAEQYKGRIAPTPADAVFGATYAFLCLGDDPDVLSVYDAMEASLGGGMVVVDHTTASARLARTLSARAATKGASFLDAPISGGQAGAENGQLSIMCGGDAAAFQQTSPILQAYGKQITLIGESGSGQLAKSVNQICIAGIIQGLAEGLHFAKQADLDIAKVIEAISGGAAQSWQMDNRWQTMRDGDYEHGFAVDWMRKDLRITLDTARENGASLPIAAMVDQYYADIQAMGGRRWDTSSLLARLGRTPD